MENIADLLKKVKSGEINIAQLAKVTGINQSKIYKWKDRDSKISHEDAVKLEAWLDKSPEVEEQEPEYHLKTHTDPIAVIADLTASNKMLAEAALILARKINLSAPAEVSSSSPEKGKVLTDPVELMLPGKQGKSGRKRGSGSFVGK